MVFFQFLSTVDFETFLLSDLVIRWLTLLISGSFHIIVFSSSGWVSFILFPHLLLILFFSTVDFIWYLKLHYWHLSRCQVVIMMLRVNFFLMWLISELYLSTSGIFSIAFVNNISWLYFSCWLYQLGKWHFLTCGVDTQQYVRSF